MPASQARPCAGSRNDKKFISPRDGGHARQGDVLDVLELEHESDDRWIAHCIWSSIVDIAPLTLSAFLISSADA